MEDPTDAVKKSTLRFWIAVPILVAIGIFLFGFDVLWGGSVRSSPRRTPLERARFDPPLHPAAVSLKNVV
jgi:hypothetical protein